MDADQLVALSAVRSLVRSGAARSIRVAADLSLAEVGRAVGVSPVAVFRWERGDRVPRGEPALRYGELLTALMRGPASRKPAAVAEGGEPTATAAAP
jgi:transcriptional regulator with XRE-family HTH domain